MAEIVYRNICATWGLEVPGGWQEQMFTDVIDVVIIRSFNPETGRVASADSRKCSSTQA